MRGTMRPMNAPSASFNTPNALRRGERSAEHVSADESVVRLSLLT